MLPILHKDQWSHCLFTIDFGKSKKELLTEFEVWLELPENKQRLEKYRMKTTGKIATAKDRLKDLAAARLYEFCGRKWLRANRLAHQHRKKTETQQPRPFYGARPSRVRRGRRKRDDRVEEANLYSEELGI